jgi:hypothetical protein
MGGDGELQQDTTRSIIPVSFLPKIIRVQNSHKSQDIHLAKTTFLATDKDIGSLGC